MGFKDKYNESKKSAELLFNKGYYNSAVNRYYYCIYQMILDYNSNNGISMSSKELKDRSHEKTIDKFIRAVNEDDEVIFKLKNSMKRLKALRKLADYEPKSITYGEMTSCRKNFEKMRDLIAQNTAN